ncbi:SAM-dependent methyltransferase [Lentzea sp. NPDC051213]|uniref:SAM-dependent methyltransferase n=1 Tax=Lentzea sp. NPDC051213 TaxID=3364126 RepID=UPI00379965ED
MSTAARTHLADKTEYLLEKYGPGPRVHYHIGLFRDVPADPAVDSPAIRRRITAAQEALVAHAARRWHADATLSGHIADIGCGLGGGSLYWAQEHGATVTAVTNVPDHIPVIRRLAAEAGVADRVTPLLTDAAELPHDTAFDGAVAMESMCYMRRDEVFARLGAVVRTGGALCVQDVFLNDPQWREPFDAYWKTAIGTVEEYVTHALAAGFALVTDEDVTDDTTEFWRQSADWAEATDGERLRDSIHWHRNFHRAWQERAIHVRLLRFEKQ